MADQVRMLNRLITKLVIYALHSKRIKGENKTQIIAMLLENIGALPIRKMVAWNNFGTLLVNGRPIEGEQLMNFRLNVMALRDNEARKILNDTKKFTAIDYGVHQGLTPEMNTFAKACLFNLQQEEELIAEILK